MTHKRRSIRKNLCEALGFAFCSSLVLVLSACKLKDETAAKPAVFAELATPNPASAQNCSDADFDAFIKRFSADITVQKKATADPLSVSRIDPEAQPEPQIVVRDLPLTEVKWPVLPNLDAARKSGREVVISESTDGYQVLVRTPDTGDQQVYQFAQRPCWVLVKVEDQAL